MKHQQYTAPELITIHLDEAACTLLSASSVKQINKENNVNIIGSTEEDDAHNACSKGFMFLDEDDFDDIE
ncbi:hypothetical protein BFS16_03160 [Hoylesella timonensis]|jgi:hypothetical protein|uniref:Uncharacterized protein n=1 Tax=Hoylesella timonensis TaxID=386414 RepID=A0A2K0XNE6_9BACT|nr:hypothetical protein [Hoylesella timonensis]PNP96056.1 hypothetical protein BFS16_03160 [Hoylesella timonensis]